MNTINFGTQELNATQLQEIQGGAITKPIIVPVTIFPPIVRIPFIPTDLIGVV